MSIPEGYTLAAERPEDAAAIELILDAAFGADRHAKRSYVYRQGVESVPALRLTARDSADRVVGTIRYWPIEVLGDGGSRPALLLGPIAVEPRLKGIGIGRALMHASLAMARARGHRLVLLVGDAAYYGQFGFVPAAPLGFVMPHEQPHRLQALELAAGSFAGGGVLSVHRPLAAARRRPRLMSRFAAV